MEASAEQAESSLLQLECRLPPLPLSCCIVIEPELKSMKNAAGGGMGAVGRMCALAGVIRVAASGAGCCCWIPEGGASAANTRAAGESSGWPILLLLTVLMLQVGGSPDTSCEASGGSCLGGGACWPEVACWFRSGGTSTEDADALLVVVGRASLTAPSATDVAGGYSGPDGLRIVPGILAASMELEGVRCVRLSRLL